MTLESVKTEFEIEFDNPWEAHVVFKSLEVEIDASPGDRSTTHFKRVNSTLKMEIDAADATSQRAALNSYLRWIILAIDILKLKEHSENSD